MIKQDFILDELRQRFVYKVDLLSYISVEMDLEGVDEEVLSSGEEVWSILKHSDSSKVFSLYNEDILNKVLINWSGMEYLNI